MKQATVKLPSGDFCFLEVPEVDPMQYFVKGNVFTWDCGIELFEFELPPGSWQLLGADPTNLTEVEAGEIVDSLIVEVGVPVRAAGYGRYTMFKNYTTDDQFNFACPVATLSLDSLAASLGISKPYCVLKNIEK